MNTTGTQAHKIAACAKCSLTAVLVKHAGEWLCAVCCHIAATENRETIRQMLAKRYRSIPVTEEMIDAIMEGLAR